MAFWPQEGYQYQQTGYGQWPQQDYGQYQQPAYGQGYGQWPQEQQYQWPPQYEPRIEKGKANGKGKWPQQQQPWSQQQQQLLQQQLLQQEWQQQWLQQKGRLQQKGLPRKGKGKGRQPQKKVLRFDLNDRVVCNLGIRWIGGHVVGTDPEEKDDWCYLVKTDPHPGFESRTISVPDDSEHVCVQEVCFAANSRDMTFTKGAAPEVSDKKPLRFEVGARVVCRVRHKADGLENWKAGEVQVVNQKLPEPLDWGDEEEDIKGIFPASVAYSVKLDGGGLVLCHADNYTLIRREGLEPQTLVKGVSKRMEERKDSSGKLVRFDHMTERHRVLDNPESDKEETVVKKETVVQLTDEQKMALFIE